MLTSLFTGISGLNANGVALSVIGDNIANANTVGFKESRANFGDILSQSLGGASAMQVGRGTMVVDIQKLFTQGTLETTSNPLDLAIDGDGFFVVKQTNGPTYYTRAGQFRLDKDGYVVDPNGYRLQAYKIDKAGNLGAIDDVNLTEVMSNSNPSATQKIDMQVNLDSRDDIKTWDFTSGPALPNSSTYNYSNAITVYDSLGNSHLVYTYFVKTAANQWDAHVIYDTGNNHYTEVGSGFTIQFNDQGKLITDPPTTPLIFDFSAWGAANSTITLNLENSTQYGAPDAVISQTQDGYTAGNLIGVTVDQNGVMSGVFTNGQVKKVAQVVLSKFIAPQNLAQAGKNLFLESYSSGGPIYGRPGTGGIGSVSANSLEASNVDLADQFIQMIAAQRGYQANVRVITTTDNMLNDLMNIIR